MSGVSEKIYAAEQLDVTPQEVPSAGTSISTMCSTKYKLRIGVDCLHTKQLCSPGLGVESSKVFVVDVGRSLRLNY